MDLLAILEVYNYGLVFVFGLFLSVFIAGGWKSKRQKLLIFVLCPLFLLIQGIISIFRGVDAVKLLYPLIVHLPLILILIFIFKKEILTSVISVCTAYLCCQIPNWIKLVVTALTDSFILGEVVYATLIFPVFLLLYDYFVPAARDAVTYSLHSKLLFGSLPLAYYLFDYFTVVYSDEFHSGIRMINEFLPTALIIFYMLFITAYQTQVQHRMQAELQNSIMETALKQSEAKIQGLRQTETQTAIYQHDMRHHLNIIQGLLTADKTKKAEEYIRKVQEEVTSFAAKLYCENEMVNLLCSSFEEKALKKGIDLQIRAKLPAHLSVPDTELCSILSNGLENALEAVSALEGPARKVELYCESKRNKLLIEIKNPCAGPIIMRDGLPVSGHKNHGYGCRSIRAITERRQGMCSFEAENGVFILRIVLPLSTVNPGTA